jgi:hypothetical protein
MSGIIIFAAIYAIIAIIGKFKEASQKAGGGAASTEHSQREQQRRQARLRQAQQRALPSQPSRTGSPGDTQAEARKLEELLRVLGQAAGVPTTEGPMGRHSRVELPAEEEVEERESLEVEERIQNLEVTSARPLRREVDFDDDAEQVVQRRIKAAADRDRPLNRSDHRLFDEKIRKVVADKTAVALPSRQRLRDAIVWREILGPPVSLRDLGGEGPREG